MTTTAVETVLAWHRALNQADIERLLGLSSEDVEVGGPRGLGQGSGVLRDWVARAGIHLEPRRVFGRGEVVVVDQAARWRSADGHLTEPEAVASVFRTRNGRVSSVIRYPDLASALHAGELDVANEVALPVPFRAPAAFEAVDD